MLRIVPGPAQLGGDAGREGVVDQEPHPALFDGRHLYQLAAGRMRKIDPETGAVLRTLESDRLVTGVTGVDGELWHGTWEGEASDLRRIDPRTGPVLARMEMPQGTGVSGLDPASGEIFSCGGGASGRLRAVRRR